MRLYKRHGLELLRGHQLGAGCFRTVNRHSEEPDKVIKVARDSLTTFHNWMEFWVWHSAPDHIKYRLAPVYGISDDGQYLIMHRVQPCTVNGKDGLPKRVLKYFRDTGSRNCGWLKLPGQRKRLVICDYALPAFPQWQMQGGVAPQTWGMGPHDVVTEAAQYTQA